MLVKEFSSPKQAFCSFKITHPGVCGARGAGGGIPPPPPTFQAKIKKIIGKHAP